MLSDKQQFYLKLVIYPFVSFLWIAVVGYVAWLFTFFILCFLAGKWVLPWYELALWTTVFSALMTLIGCIKLYPKLFEARKKIGDVNVFPFQEAFLKTTASLDILAPFVKEEFPHNKFFRENGVLVLETKKSELNLGEIIEIHETTKGIVFKSRSKWLTTINDGGKNVLNLIAFIDLCETNNLEVKGVTNV